MLWFFYYLEEWDKEKNVSASKEGVVQFPPAIDILDKTNIS